MFARVIADRYAQAVLRNCPDLDTIDLVKRELELLKETYDTAIDFRKFLLNPKVPTILKRKMIEKSLKGKIGDLTLNLLLLLIEKRRQDILPDISERFSELCDKVRGVEQAEITTAVPISDDLGARLTAAVQRFSTRQVEVNFDVDLSIIGGVVIRMGDQVIDGSLKRRFEDQRRAMLATRLPRSVSSSE
jgi:F-type H+-transporting ATPase subunit delta